MGEDEGHEPFGTCCLGSFRAEIQRERAEMPPEVVAELDRAAARVRHLCDVHGLDPGDEGFKRAWYLAGALAMTQVEMALEDADPDAQEALAEVMARLEAHMFTGFWQELG